MAASLAEYVKVRSKKTGTIEVRRANELSRHSKTPAREHVLHYIGVERLQVCRCTTPSEHFEKTIQVAAESTHLNAGLMMYLTRHGLETCSITAFRNYSENREAMWREQGVNIDTFHYMSHSKNQVCRCLRPNKHNGGAPRNPEIIEQCAEFFILHQDKTVCTRSEWRGIEGDSPPVYFPPGLSPVCPTPVHSHSLHKPSYSSDPQQPVLITYNSQTTQELLDDWTVRKVTTPEIEFQSTGNPLIPLYTQDSSSGIFRKSDIPAKVWESARPSACVSPHCSESVVSTPMGTTISQLPILLTPATRFYESGSTKHAQRNSLTTYRSKFQYDASNTLCARPVLVAESSISQPSDHTVKSECEHIKWEGMGLRDDSAGLCISYSQDDKLESHLQESGPIYPDSNQCATSIAELPDQIAVVKLDADFHHHYPPYRCFNTHLELLGEQSSLNASSKSSNMAHSTKDSPLLSPLPQHVHNILRLPNQEELLLRHAVVSSGAGLPPAGDCTVCGNMYENHQKRIIVPCKCEHSIHEDCLVESFRSRDQRIGTCPVCSLGICERTLADRIHTDRLAIFGSQFTRLRNQVDITFPQHNEVVTCNSEEEVAAAQLRLIKDYVDVHSEEIFRIWELNRAEPDWFMGIVRPVVKLFQAWDVPNRQSRYFVDKESFLKLLAWAELVRLMSNGRRPSAMTEGEDAIYPQLSELHRKFEMALTRYDQEKILWGEDEGRIPDCDRVAQDLVDLAMRIKSA
ncbi:hypothetical protein IAQ61_009373 [Plenodomus lingam]|uniref:RING-type domain-containing protein n=1 Tax=Leptosphaeria maculans (strain JN3 / isolate v23.1.3 / race Av1-4-5-6-7-8) TaxID=985895 RepID=E4ZTY1_LEPMJ|nr:hypothetical protein LEMA_P116940.1 [Plenodomus lingam JN3]KAH9863096.1 hypothetical protein IAQ61_009373 [Plenodomus lingam]CBX94691.1 hypothetical protein LEMA_P116940.1 [Plenodomus lingam JN3]